MQVTNANAHCRSQKSNKFAIVSCFTFALIYSLENSFQSRPAIGPFHIMGSNAYMLDFPSDLMK